MSAEIVSREDQALDEIREAVKGRVRFEIVPIYFNPQPEAIQIQHQVPSKSGLTQVWRPVGPLLFPAEDQTLADVFRMLIEMRHEGGDE